MEGGSRVLTSSSRFKAVGFSAFCLILQLMQRLNSRTANGMSRHGRVLLSVFIEGRTFINGRYVTQAVSLRRKLTVCVTILKLEKRFRCYVRCNVSQISRFKGTLPMRAKLRYCAVSDN